MKIFKTSNKFKQMRLAKFESARQAIGKIEKNTDTFCLTFGQFSLIDALEVILKQTGKAHVVVSSWTAAQAHLARAKEMMARLDVESFRMIIDRSFKTRQPDYYKFLLEHLGVECIRQINTHAKFLVIHNDNFNIVVRTSMNFNENPRLENIEISENKNFTDFFLSLTDEIFKEVQQNETKSSDLKLIGLKTTCKVKEVGMGKVDYKNLNEVEASYGYSN